MKTAEQTVTLRSDKHYGRKLPPHAFGQVLQVLPVAVRRSIRMAFEGRSRARGKPPGWLTAAADIRFLGHSGDDDTILHFESPQLGDAAAVLYQQQELWSTPKPAPTDTGFDLLGDVLSDLATNNPDSERFDRPLLEQVGSFRHALGKAFCEMGIVSHRYSAQQPVIVNEAVVRNARTLVRNTPQPQRVRVVGTLDMIRASTATFAIVLDDGREIRGVMVGGDSDVLGQHYKQRVLVLGKAVYRPSGNPLRIDADEMTSASEQGTYFSQLPKPTRKKFDLRQVLREQQHKKGLSAIFGRWPGTETDEQIQQALKELG